ncbi:Transmembrane O-methyltransferase [Liparis tanakae]|uniref:catechol O-methyltransferase n=1 Tax=Liparis tanakae TaxID=230148 RepID=A0A4Z2ILT4_9TELE|nr:Transmembrane O-methyltransferase [Liparis tanakae]
MWLVVASVPLLPALLLVASSRCRVKVAALGRVALRLLLRRGAGGGRVCVRSTHSFVFSQCTHGKAHSVLSTFDLYADTHPSLCIGPQTGEALDEAVARARPSRVLELGTHCGYSSVRMLRLLPPGGRLVTVELDPLTAELGEELILVAGFKHHQFQVLTSSSAEAIPALRSSLELDPGPGEGLDLVLMDHDPERYLPDLLALEREELLCPSGCSVLLIHRNQGAGERGGLGGLLAHVRARPGRYSVESERSAMTEIVYRKERSTKGE